MVALFLAILFTHSFSIGFSLFLFYLCVQRQVVIRDYSCATVLVDSQEAGGWWENLCFLKHFFINIRNFQLKIRAEKYMLAIDFGLSISKQKTNFYSMQLLIIPTKLCSKFLAYRIHIFWSPFFRIMILYMFKLHDNCYVPFHVTYCLELISSFLLRSLHHCPKRSAVFAWMEHRIDPTGDGVSANIPDEQGAEL